MRRVRTRVLPDPAGARITRGIAGDDTAARCASSRPSSSVAGSIARDPTLHPVVDISIDRFEELVADALDSIPPELGRLMDNVAVVVKEGSAGSRLPGRYDGIPLTARDASYAGMVMPEPHTPFRPPLPQASGDHGEL